MRWLDINCLPIPVYFDIKIYLLLIHMYISSIYLVINIDLFWLLIVLSSWTTVNWWYMCIQCYYLVISLHVISFPFCCKYLSQECKCFMPLSKHLSNIKVHSNGVTTWKVESYFDDQSQAIFWAAVGIPFHWFYRQNSQIYNLYFP